MGLRPPRRPRPRPRRHAGCVACIAGGVLWWWWWWWCCFVVFCGGDSDSVQFVVEVVCLFDRAVFCHVDVKEGSHTPSQSSPPRNRRGLRAALPGRQQQSLRLHGFVLHRPARTGYVGPVLHCTAHSGMMCGCGYVTDDCWQRGSIGRSLPPKSTPPNRNPNKKNIEHRRRHQARSTTGAGRFTRSSPRRAASAGGKSPSIHPDG